MNFDKVLGEWQSKAADVSAEVAASQDEGRNYSSELFRLKAAGDEGLEQLDIVKRENKNLADEIKDLLDQLGEGGRSIHDLDKQRRRLEQEKEELQGALEEAEGTLEQEENKVLRAQLELGQVKQEIDRRVAEKEEEFNNTRKNHARAMESMSASLEAEQKAKGEALRVKKALEGEINELEIGLDHANKANSEGLKSIKRYQGQLKETIQLYEDEARSRSQIMEQVGISERKAAALSGELEESKALMDSSERAKRQLEMEIADGRNAVNNMQVINGRDMTAKRGLEGAIHTIQAEVDAMLGAAKNAEEKWARGCGGRASGHPRDPWRCRYGCSSPAWRRNHAGSHSSWLPHVCRASHGCQPGPAASAVGDVPRTWRWACLHGPRRPGPGCSAASSAAAGSRPATDRPSPACRLTSPACRCCRHVSRRWRDAGSTSRTGRCYVLDHPCTGASSTCCPEVTTREKWQQYPQSHTAAQSTATATAGSAIPPISH